MVDLYFLVFIHIGSRRIWVSPCTANRRATGRLSRPATSTCSCKTRTCHAQSCNVTRTQSTSKRSTTYSKAMAAQSRNADQVTESAGVRRARHSDAQARGLKRLLRRQREAPRSHPENRGRLVQQAARPFGPRSPAAGSRRWRTASCGLNEAQAGLPVRAWRAPEVVSHRGVINGR